jgi:hypothetical protein
MTSKPNFFIVGAPKCATTALATYLDRHPEVGLIGKEVHFFGSDLEFRRRLPTLDEYLALARPLAHLPAVGDASVYYLFSKTAPGEIKAFCPEARIIIMLRNPVDVIYSLHRQLLSNADEDIEDFEQALAAEPERTAGRCIPRSAHPAHALRYRAMVAFPEQVARYLRAFGRERVLILLYDDIVGDAPGVFRTTLEFLGIDPEFRTTLERINEARRLRFRTARRIQKNLPKAMLNWMPRPLWSSVSAMYCGLVYADAKPSPMRPALRARLLEEFRPEIDRLSGIIERDMSHWYASPEASSASAA